MDDSALEKYLRVNAEAVLKYMKYEMSGAIFGDCARMLLESAQCLPTWLVSLPLITCVAAGGAPEDGTALASGWLAGYLASEILDHVEDKEFIPDHWACSPELAINLASGLIFLAYRFLTLIRDPEKSRRVARIFSESGLSASYGQQRTLMESQVSVNEALDSYWEKIILKAGSVFHAATAGGAVAGSEDQRCLAALGDYGTALGVMLQLIDDCRDLLIPSQNVLTWEVSLPLLLYLMTIREEKIYFPDINSKAELVALFKEAGVINAISSLVIEWRQRALASLEVLGESAEKQLLELIPSRFLESLNGDSIKVPDGSPRRA